MSDDNIYQDGPAPAAPAPDLFSMMLPVINLITDAKASKDRLLLIRSEIERSEKAKADAETAQAVASQRLAALDEREAELSQQENELAEERTALREERQEFADRINPRIDDLNEREHRLKWRTLHLAGLLENYNERMQGLPDWPTIDRAVFGKALDPLFGDENPPDVAGDTEPVPDRPAGSVLTRTKERSPATRRSMRRATGDVAH